MRVWIKTKDNEAREARVPCNATVGYLLEKVVKEDNYPPSTKFQGKTLETTRRLKDLQTSKDDPIKIFEGTIYPSLFIDGAAL